MHKKKLLPVVLTTALVLSLVGCQAKKTPDQAIKDGLKNLSSDKALSYDLALNADLKDKDAKEGKLNLALSGALDSKDQQDPKYTLKIDGSMQDASSDQAGSAQAELRLNKDQILFNVMKLDIQGVTLPTEATALMNQWWKFPLPPATKAALLKAANYSTQQLTPEQQKLKDLYENTKFFTDPKYVADETIGGEQSAHYTAMLDKTAVLNFFKAVAENQGETVTDDQMKQAQDGFSYLDTQVGVWVGNSSNTVNQVVVSANVNDTKDSVTGTVFFRLTLSDFNKAVQIDVPADAKDFPVELLGGLLGGAGEATQPGADFSTGDTQMVPPVTAPVIKAPVKK